VHVNNVPLLIASAFAKIHIAWLDPHPELSQVG
jgi:hypothetical protein